jgi:lipopolysaccharide export system protein LptA
MKTFLDYSISNNKQEFQSYGKVFYLLPRFRIVLFLTAKLLLLTLLAGPAVSKPDPHKLEPSQEEKISVQSDMLIVDNEKRYAEFTGNVKVIQGTTDIIADRLKIHYKKSANKSESYEKSIEKIVASGNVAIKFDDKTAVTDEAVYETKTRIMILSGEGSRITSDKNSISGAKITIYRDSELIRVEGSGEKPVEATFYSEEKGLD